MNLATNTNFKGFVQRRAKPYVFMTGVRRMDP